MKNPIASKSLLYPLLGILAASSVAGTILLTRKKKLPQETKPLLETLFKENASAFHLEIGHHPRVEIIRNGKVTTLNLNRETLISEFTKLKSQIEKNDHQKSFLVPVANKAAANLTLGNRNGTEIIIGSFIRI